MNIKLSIPNITCGHCVMAIKNELSDIKGVSKIEGVANSKTITIEWDEPANLEKIKERLADINYPVGD